MKKRVLSLLLCVALCLSILPAALLPASAAGVRVSINGSDLTAGTPVSLYGGTAKYTMTGTKLTLELDNCRIPGSAKVGLYEYGIYVSAERDVEIVLSGENECFSAMNITTSRDVSVISGSTKDGKLLVHGSTFISANSFTVGNVELELKADQSNAEYALQVYGHLIVGKTAVKGGSTYSEPHIEIDTQRPLGIKAIRMTINDGIINVTSKITGVYLETESLYQTGLTVTGGITDLSAGQAAILIRDFVGYNDAVSFSNSWGEYQKDYCVQSAQFEPYEGALANTRLWSWCASNVVLKASDPKDVGGYDFTCNAAKSVAFREMDWSYVTYDCGDFGEINGSQYRITLYPYGEAIGVLPVPVNTTFAAGSFNNMYFEGWAINGDMNQMVDETYKPTRDITLKAVWMEGQSSMPFKDVKKTDWFYNAVRYCYGQSLISGTGDGKTFSPYTNCTRAMIVTILYRMEGNPSVGAQSPFSDVPKGMWYTDAVLWAAEHGIVSGDGKGHFMPNANVTREQLAVIIQKYADYTAHYNSRDNVMLAGFPDEGKVSNWAGEAMSWAYGRGLITGKKNNGETLLDPKGNATRAEFASILMRFIQNFDGALSFYAGDSFTVTVSELWQGNVVARHRVDEHYRDCLDVYAKKVLLDANGNGGRLFTLIAYDEGDNSFLQSPNYDGIFGVLRDTDKYVVYLLIRETPTDVQCEHYQTEPLGALYHSMSIMQDFIDISNEWYLEFVVPAG